MLLPQPRGGFPASSRLSDTTSTITSVFVTSVPVVHPNAYSGGHRCPPTQRRKFEGHTTNQDFYQPYQIQPDRRPQPQYTISQRRYDPEQLQTTYNVQYTPKRSRIYTDPARDASIEYVKNKAPFYSET